MSDSVELYNGEEIYVFASMDDFPDGMVEVYADAAVLIDMCFDFTVKDLKEEVRDLVNIGLDLAGARDISSLYLRADVGKGEELDGALFVGIGRKRATPAWRTALGAEAHPAVAARTAANSSRDSVISFSPAWKSVISWRPWKNGPTSREAPLSLGTERERTRYR